MSDLLERILGLDDAIRYVAIYRDGQLEMRSKAGTANTSSSETDRYEELLVNPTLLKLATQRGEIDCGGLRYLLIAYGHFFQYVRAKEWGHVSVCIEKSADATEIAGRLEAL